MLASLCACAGIALAGGRRARILVPISGALLAGVAVFGLIPELVHEIGWIAGPLLVAAGYGLLTLLDGLGYPVCPSCRHGEKFAGSLVLATAVHAFADGWGMVATANRGAVSAAIGAAILIHKIPEGLALGAMLRVSEPRFAVWLAIVAEAPTVLGGAVGLQTLPGIWVNYPLAVAAGTFLFLGLHAVRQRVWVPR